MEGNAPFFEDFLILNVQSRGALKKDHLLASLDHAIRKINKSALNSVNFRGIFN